MMLPMLLGAAGDRVTVSNATVTSVVVGGSATAGYRLNADGKIYRRRNQDSGGAYQLLGDWITPNSNAADYECTWTAGSGTVDSPPGTAGTWLALSSSRTWEEVSPAGVLESCSFTVRIRKIGLTDESTAVITLEADGSS